MHERAGKPREEEKRGKSIGLKIKSKKFVS